MRFAHQRQRRQTGQRCGAQILLAASLAHLSPMALIGKAHYCWLLIAITIGFMLWPGRRTAVVADPAKP